MKKLVVIIIWCIGQCNAMELTSLASNAQSFSATIADIVFKKDPSRFNKKEAQQFKQYFPRLFTFAQATHNPEVLTQALGRLVLMKYPFGKCVEQLLPTINTHAFTAEQHYNCALGYYKDYKQNTTLGNSSALIYHAKSAMLKNNAEQNNCCKQAKKLLLTLADSNIEVQLTLADSAASDNELFTWFNKALNTIYARAPFFNSEPIGPIITETPCYRKIKERALKNNVTARYMLGHAAFIHFRQTYNKIAFEESHAIINHAVDSIKQALLAGYKYNEVGDIALSRVLCDRAWLLAQQSKFDEVEQDLSEGLFLGNNTTIPYTHAYIRELGNDFTKTVFDHWHQELIISGRNGNKNAYLKLYKHFSNPIANPLMNGYIVMPDIKMGQEYWEKIKSDDKTISVELNQPKLELQELLETVSDKNFQEGLKLYYNGNAEQSIDYFLQALQKKQTLAQFFLGHLASHGYSTKELLPFDLFNNLLESSKKNEQSYGIKGLFHLFAQHDYKAAYRLVNYFGKSNNVAEAATVFSKVEKVIEKEVQTKVKLWDIAQEMGCLSLLERLCIQNNNPSNLVTILHKAFATRYNCVSLTESKPLEYKINLVKKLLDYNVSDSVFETQSEALSYLVNLWSKLGSLYLINNNRSQALEAFKKAYFLASNNTKVQEGYMISLFINAKRLKDKNVAKAMDILQSLCSKEPLIFNYCAGQLYLSRTLYSKFLGDYFLDYFPLNIDKFIQYFTSIAHYQPKDEKEKELKATIIKNIYNDLVQNTQITEKQNKELLAIAHVLKKENPYAATQLGLDYFKKGCFDQSYELLKDIEKPIVIQQPALINMTLTGKLKEDHIEQGLEIAYSFMELVNSSEKLEKSAPLEAFDLESISTYLKLILDDNKHPLHNKASLFVTWFNYFLSKRNGPTLWHLKAPIGTLAGYKNAFAHGLISLVCSQRVLEYKIYNNIPRMLEYIKKACVYARSAFILSESTSKGECTTLLMQDVYETLTLKLSLIDPNNEDIKNMPSLKTPFEMGRFLTDVIVINKDDLCSSLKASHA